MRPLCRTCDHYIAPGTWSAVCRLGPPDWQHQRRDPAYSIVRADNSCGRHSATADLPVSRAA